MSCGEPAEATPRAGCPRGRGTGRATLGGQAGPLRAVQGPRVFSGLREDERSPHSSHGLQNFRGGGIRAARRRILGRIDYVTTPLPKH